MVIKNNLKHQKTSTSSRFKGLPVNASEDNPSYVSILEKLYRELTSLIAIHSRTVIVRLDLHPDNGCDPTLISMNDFCRSFQRKLKNKYKSEVAYQWVLESGNKKYNKGFHWHLWVGVKNHPDHQPKRQAREMYDIIEKSWVAYAGGKCKRNHHSGFFYIERKNLYPKIRKQQQKSISEGGLGVLLNLKCIYKRINNKNIVLGGVIDECFFSLSYLAKVFSKVRTPHSYGKRLFASSNINLNKFKESRKKEISINIQNIEECLTVGIEKIPVDTDS